MVNSRKRMTAALVATVVATGVISTVGMSSAAAANGCQNITASSGGYAQTTAEYASAWSVTTPSGYGVYWYIKHTDGSIQDHGFVSGFTAISEPANIYYLQISNPNYNPGLTVQVCYDG